MAKKPDRVALEKALNAARITRRDAVVSFQNAKAALDQAILLQREAEAALNEAIAAEAKTEGD